MSKSGFEQAMAARLLSDTFGALHSLQMESLELWGYLAFPHCSYGEVQVQADIDSKLLIFKINTKAKKPDNQDDLFTLLHNSVTTLLGPAWDLQVFDGKDLVYGFKVRTKEEKLNEQRKLIARAGSSETE